MLFTFFVYFFGRFCQGNVTLQWGEKGLGLWIIISETGTSPPLNNAEVWAKWMKMIFLEGGGMQHCWVGDGVKKLSVELDSYVYNLLERVFQTVPSSFDLHCICSFDAENVKLLWFVPFSLH